jgi:hypothetical protein
MTMRAAALAVVLACAPWAARGAEQPSFTFALSGQNVRDAGGAVAGDPDATAVATLSAVQNTLVWSLDYQNLGGDTVTGLHLHAAGAAGDAPVALDLLAGHPPKTLPLPSPSGTLSGVVTPDDDPGLLTRMSWVFYAGQETFALEVHTSGPGGFPGGAMAGVLPEPGCLGVVALGAVGLLRPRR